MCEFEAQWEKVRSVDRSVRVSIFIVFQAMGLVEVN